MDWDAHLSAMDSARAEQRQKREEAARAKSPTPIDGSNWLLSVLNGDGDIGRKVDAMATAACNRAVRRISQDLARPPVVIQERTAGGSWKVVEPLPRGVKNPRFGDVAGVFERANPREGRSALWRKFHQGMLRHGSVYLFNDYGNNGEKPRAGQFPKELRALSTNKLEPVFPQDRGMFTDPVGYRVKGSSARPLRPDEVMFSIYPDIEDDWNGLGPLEIAAPYASMEDALTAYTNEFFDNGARGTVALQSDQTPSEEQRKQLEDAWNRKQVGRGKRFKVWLLTHGLKATELSGRRDTDFADLWEIITGRVCMVFGLPPGYLGDMTNSSDRGNYEEQAPVYFEGALEPDGDLLKQNLTEIVLPRFDPNGSLRALLDWDSVPMVQRMMLKKATAYFTLVGGPIMTPNESRKALNLEPLTGGDQTYPQGAQPLGIGPVATPRPTRTAAKATRSKWIDDPARHAKRIASGVSLDRFEKPAEKMVRAHFTQAEQRALHAFEHGKSYKATKDAGDLYDEEIEVDAARHLIARIYADIANKRGPEAAVEVGGEPGDFLLTDPEVRAFLEERAYENGVRIVGTTADLLKQAIATANSEGLTVQETANLIRDVFAVRRDQALTIARTETVRAYNFTTIEAWKQTGLVEEIAWLTAHDEAVRESHRAIDGDKVKLGERFDNGLRWPGDPDGPAEEVCNCRCVPDYVPPSESKFHVAPGTFAKLFRLTPSNSPTDKAAV